MISYPDLEDVLELHAEIIDATGGSDGLRDINGLISAIENPRRTFAGQELYPTLIEKAAILLYSLVQNHPFIDGNKRVGHGAAELLLRENEQTIRASDDELESLILSVASSRTSLESLVAWMRNHVTDLPATDD